MESHKIHVPNHQAELEIFLIPPTSISGSTFHILCISMSYFDRWWNPHRSLVHSVLLGEIQSIVYHPSPSIVPRLSQHLTSINWCINPIQHPFGIQQLVTFSYISTINSIKKSILIHLTSINWFINPSISNPFGSPNDTTTPWVSSHRLLGRGLQESQGIGGVGFHAIALEEHPDSVGFSWRWLDFLGTNFLRFWMVLVWQMWYAKPLQALQKCGNPASIQSPPSFLLLKARINGAIHGI